MRVDILFLALMSAAAPGASPGPSVKDGIEAWKGGDFAKATAIWRTRAEAGEADAAFNLGQAYRLGRGVEADAGKAKSWFERAARAGHLDAQVSLGLLLFDSGNRAQGLDWLNRAAQRGEPRALLVVGTALFNGDGVKQDPVLGYSYVSRAAAQRLKPAQTTLADMDKILPLEQRKRGVALALEAVKGATATDNKKGPPSQKEVATKTAPPVPKPKPMKSTAKAAPPAVAATSGGWRIQLGAFSAAGSAQSLFAKLKGKLGGAKPYYVKAGSVTRLQAGPYASRDEASKVCAALKPQPCFPVAAK